MRMAVVVVLVLCGCGAGERSSLAVVVAMVVKSGYLAGFSSLSRECGEGIWSSSGCGWVYGCTCEERGTTNSLKRCLCVCAVYQP